MQRGGFSNITMRKKRSKCAPGKTWNFYFCRRTSTFCLTEAGPSTNRRENLIGRELVLVLDLGNNDEHLEGPSGDQEVLKPKCDFESRFSRLKLEFELLRPDSASSHPSVWPRRTPALPSASPLDARAHPGPSWPRPWPPSG